MPALVNALKSVDLPTLGKPTMPHWRLMESFELVKRRAPGGSTPDARVAGFSPPGATRLAGGHVVRAGKTAIVAPRVGRLGGREGSFRLSAGPLQGVAPAGT